MLLIAPLPTHQFDVDFLSLILSFLACVGLCPLLFLEHTRSIKPSDLAIVYLLASLLCDAAVLGTSTYQHVSFWATLRVGAKLCLKLTLLIVESRGKWNILRCQYGQYSPEQLVGLLSRTYFWWINSILARGSKDILTEDSLPPLDRNISSKLLRYQALKAWDQRGNVN